MRYFSGVCANIRVSFLALHPFHYRFMHRYPDSPSPLIDRRRTRAAIKLFASHSLSDLAAHPYTALPIVAALCNADGGSATPQAQTQALYDLLHEAIESLKPTKVANPLHVKGIRIVGRVNTAGNSSKRARVHEV